jgi:LacI family transcriptional regulator
LNQELLAATQERADELAEHVIANGHDNDPATELAIVQQLVTRAQVDGLVLWPTRDSRATIDFLEEEDMPYVLVPEPDLEIHGRSSTVSADDAGATACLMEHLIESGHRRVGFAVAAGAASESSFAQRHRQYAHSLSQAGLEVLDPIYIEGDAVHNTFDVSAAVVRRLKKLDALFCATDALAAAVIARCVEVGIRVPGDLAVAGYDNSDVARLLSLTSVEQHFGKIGRRAVEFLLEEIETGKKAPVHLTVESELIVRRSTGNSGGR